MVVAIVLIILDFFHCIQTTVVPFRKDQVWTELRSKYNQQNLFTDYEFQPNEKSLSGHHMNKLAVNIPIVWKRTSDVVKNPKFIISDSEICGDLDQGYMNQSWFIATCICLRRFNSFFSQVIPHDQGFGDDYAGNF